MATIKGGDKFEAALADLAKRVAQPGTLKVGFFEDATYPDGTSVAFVAAMNEYGHEYNGVVTPPRPFFRNMIHDKSPEWPAALAGLLKANDMDAVKALNLAGEAIKGQLQQSIRDLVSPSLAESTIARKGFDKPLIETAVMLNAVGAKVET